MTEENLEASYKEDGCTQVLYDQLQSEYNKLLKQYAAAENTIDELRTGATVHLYTEPLESRPASRLSIETARYSQNIDFPRALQASTSEFSSMNDSYSKNFSTGGRIITPRQGEKNGENLSLFTRIHALKEDVNTVECVFSESGGNNEGTLNELLVICKQLDKEHGLLTHELKLQSRNTLSASSDANNFSTKTELQKELHRIGLRIEEIQGDIIAKLKTKKPAVVQLPLNDEKHQNDEKPSLSKDLQNLVKEMKDLKDASIRNSEDLLNSSKGKNAKTGTGLPHRRYSEPKTDMVDPQYFTASPVNMNHPENSLSGSDGCENGDERTLNMTWPPSRNTTDADIGILRHSYSETNQRCGDSVPDDVKTRFSSSNPSRQNTHNADKTSSYSRKPGQFKSGQHRSDSKLSESERRNPLNLSDSREHSLCSEEEAVRRRSEAGYLEHDRRDDRMYTRAQSPFSSQETLRYRSDLDRPNHERNVPLKPTKTRQPPHSGEELSHNDKRLPKHPGHEREALYRNTRDPPPPSHEEILPHGDHHFQTRQTEKRNETPERRVGSPDLGARTFHSMSSLADSSRMSTPLFQPRGTTRLPTRGSQAPRHKQRTPSDGFDSGFVGSEASRSSRVVTDHPDGEQKLNLSNQWDSSLHLDLVSEIDENEATTSPEQISTTYEHAAESGRQSPRKWTKSEQMNEDIKFINASPSPPLSTEGSSMTHTGYFGHRTSHNRLPSNSGNSSPVLNTSDPLLSHSNEKPLLERRCSSGHDSGPEKTSQTRVDRRRISRRGSRDVSSEMTADIRVSGEPARSERRTNEQNNARKLQSLRNELDSLHDHVNKLQHPRVTVDMYDELRDHDEQLRRAHERRHERKLDELRQNIEQLKKDIKSKNRQDRRKPDWDTEFYDDFRSELRKVTDKLDELTALRNTSQRPLESSTAHAAPSETYSASHPSHDEQMAERFGNLVRKVDELRLSVENRRDNFNPRRETSRYFCPLCHEAEIHHHGNRTVNTTHHQPQTSTPFAPDVHQQRKQTANLDHRSYLSSTFPGARPQQTPVVHHIHTYHEGRGLQEYHETDSDDERNVTRTPRRKRGVRRSSYRSRNSYSHRDHLSLDEAHKAAWEVQRLSKNILNTISLDLSSLRS